MNPLYQHDCSSCTFLGSVEGAAHPGDLSKKTDLYVCGRHEHLTVIARYSSDLPDYSSGLAFAFLEHPHLLLREAARRALLLPGMIPAFMKSLEIQAYMGPFRIMLGAAQSFLHTNLEERYTIASRILERVGFALTPLEDLKIILQYVTWKDGATFEAVQEMFSGITREEVEATLVNVYGYETITKL